LGLALFLSLWLSPNINPRITLELKMGGILMAGVPLIDITPECETEKRLLFLS